MRARILSSVLFPAPLLPISATTSPRAISTVTSRSAQCVAASDRGVRRNPRRTPAAMRLTSIASFLRFCTPTGNAFDSPTTRIAASDDIGEGPLGLLEVRDTAHEDDK